jgi:hypothetical protein
MKGRPQNISKFVYWTPRILSILFIAFLTLFSLDVFDNDYTFWQAIGALLMHNIPVFLLIIVLVISWKYEIVGGAAFILGGLLYLVTTLMRQPWYIVISWSMIIAGPAFFIGILFLMNWYKKKK